MSKKCRFNRGQSTILSVLLDARQRHIAGTKNRSQLRRLLSEQLEPRQMLAVDIRGDMLAAASLASGHADGQLEISVTMGGDGAAAGESTPASGTVLDDQPNPIRNVGLVRDTGHDRHDRRTVNPEIEGQVVGSFGNASLRVEFDHDRDGITDGLVAVATLPADFAYDPRVSDPSLAGYVGDVPMRYRFALTEADGQVIETAWDEFAFVLDAVPTSAYVVKGLAHSGGQGSTDIPGPSVSLGTQISGHVNAIEGYYGSGYGSGYDSSYGGCEGPMGPFPAGELPTGEPGSDFEDPYLGEGCGPSAGSDLVDGTDPPSLPLAVPVEIDLDMDGVVDATTTTNTELDFNKYFASLDTGVHNIQARALEWNDDYGMYLIGAWSQHSFRWENASAPDVVKLELLNDTGLSKSDRITQDPRITGELVQPFHNVTDVEIEYDLDGDRTADGVADATTTTDDKGDFQFTPTGLALGPTSIAVRGVAYNYASASLRPGAWSSIAFSLVASTNEPAVISQLGLLNDSGIPGDNRTEDPRLTGRVLNDSSAEGIAVELDIDGDGRVDQTAFSDKLGRFIIDPFLSARGSTTVSMRAVEFDSQASANVAGPWSTYSFVYEDQVDTPPRTLELEFNAGDIANGVLPALSGKVSYQHSNCGLRVEVDSDADGSADHSATTDAYGQFMIQFENLPNRTVSIDVRALATNPGTKAFQSEAWQAFSIGYVVSSPAAATIVGLRLAEDTGASSTDRSTMNPKVVGSVSRKPVGRLMVVEVDTDGDAVADGTTIVGANLQWSYFPVGLAIGSVTVSARTRDTAVNGQAVFGPWSHLTFALQSSVDTGGASEEQDRQAAIGDANNQAISDRNAAGGHLSDAITAAEQRQKASVAIADNQFNRGMAQAADAFAQAQAVAAANYQSTLVAFGGNTTSFNFEPIAWPDAPQLDRFSLPADGSLPQPPMAKPDYQGPVFDFNGSVSASAARNLAKSAYSTAVFKAASDRRSQDQAANQAYRDAVEIERQRASDARKAARDAYQSAIAQPALTDLSAARDTYNSALQTATDNYRSAVESANQTRQSLSQIASESASSSYESTWSSFQDTADSARNALMSVLNSRPQPSTAARKAASDAYASKMLTAGKARDQANSDISYASTDVTITANKAWYQALADAQRTLSQAQNRAAHTYDDAVAARDSELRSRKISATIALENALAAIARDTLTENADAVRDRDKQLATNAAVEQLAIAQAESTAWVAEANAKKLELDAWKAAVGSPWTAYQADLAGNELAYYQSLRVAHNARAQALADAERIRAGAIADAQHRSAADTSHEKQTLDQGYSKAKSTYWAESAAALSSATFESNATRNSIRDELADAAHVRAYQIADDGETYARTVNEARHDYATAMVSAGTLEGVAASTAIDASLAFTIARNNAGQRLSIGNINNNREWSTTYRSAWDRYSVNLHTASATQTNDIAGDLKQFHETLAPLDRDYAIAISEIEGDASRANAAAQLAYVQAVAPADKAYEFSDVRFVGIRELGDARDLKVFRVAEATMYAAQMNAWHAAVDSPWSAMSTNQGSIEIAWANITGSAEVAFATAMNLANLARVATQAEAKRLWQINLANAGRTRVDSIANQNDVYVGAIAAAKYAFAMSAAGYSLIRSQDANNISIGQRTAEHEWSSSHFGAAAAYETVYQIAMINANTNYANARASADATHSGAAASSSASYSAGNIGWEAHRSNLDGATDKYNSDMSGATSRFNSAAKAAWEAIRDARAASLSQAQAHAADSTQFHAQFESISSRLYPADEGSAEKLLADAVYAAKTTLATSHGTTEKSYVATVAPLDAAYEVKLRQSDNAHGYAATSAATTKNRKVFIADAARREDQVAARGIYETAAYQKFASIKTSIASANPNPRALAEADAAIADAVWANAVRVARDASEDAISIAGLSQVNAINAAIIRQVSSINAATYNYTNTLSWAESAYHIALANAATDLSIVGAISEAFLERQAVYASVDYDIAAADANFTLTQELRDLAETYSAGVGDSYEQYYIDAAGEWRDITWTDQPYDSYYGYYGGGYYGGGYYGGGYYGGGYYGGGYYGGDYYGGGYYGGGYYGGGYYGGGYYGGGYGFGWGGWGLGYYWGFGFGGFGGGSSNANSNLQDSLVTTSDTFNADAIAAHAAYATAIGDADVDRATMLGDANLQAADGRGSGGVAYAIAINLAASNRTAATLAAAKLQTIAIASANKIHANTLSTARRDNSLANENATVGLTNLKQTATVSRAGNLATAEAKYQVATANQQAAFATTIANRSSTPDAAYAAAYSQAKATWIAGVAQAFVAHAITVATADGQAAFDIANARGVRNRTKANADKVFDNAQSAYSYARSIGGIAPSGIQLTGLLGLQNTRRLSAANHSKAYEHGVAAAESALGIAHAEDSKQREVDRANKVAPETYNDDYDTADGDSKLIRDAAIADATLAWHQAEAIDQQAFTISSVPLDQAFSVATSGLDRTYQRQVATAEEARQFRHAAAEGAFFHAETAAKNSKRSSTANATIALWKIQESVRGDVHADIDNALQSPWSEYLLDAAKARSVWWNRVAGQYANLAAEQNIAESTYTARLATGHRIHQQTIATATKNKSFAEADAQAAEATAKAVAVRDYFINMVVPTKTYVDALANAERQKTVDIAQAYRDTIDHESTSRRDQAIRTANNTFNDTKHSQDSTYRSALAVAQADQYVDFATAEFNRTASLVAADVALVISRNNAERTARNGEAGAYLQSATSWATLDAVYRQYEANSFASAAAALAQSNGLPWTVYDADFYAARAVHMTAVSNAAKTKAIAQATAQSTVEIGQTNAETTWRNTIAASTSMLNTTIASAQLGYAAAQAFVYSNMDGGDLELPSGTHPTDLDSEYTVAAPQSSHRATLYTVNRSSYFNPYGGYWWGAWGYYGNGNWFSDYGDYQGYLVGGQVSSAASVSLVEPALQFSTSFWQIDSEQVADQVRDSELHTRYGDAMIVELVTPVDIAEGALRTLNIPARESAESTSTDQVADELEATNPELADFVRENGQVSALPISERPVVNATVLETSRADASAPTRGSSPSSGDRFYITVSSNWNAATIATAIDQAAGGEESPLQNGARIRQLFDQHIDARTPGFETRQTGRFTGAGVRYNIPDTIIALETGVYWRSFKQETFFGGEVGTTSLDTKVGVLANDGWVRLLSGERTTLSALSKWSKAFSGASIEQINMTLDAIISPFHVDSAASQLGIFIGGTGMHFLGLGNVERLYNVYEGSKFYYGGLNNPIDFKIETVSLSGGFGLGWTTILDRAVADIKTYLRPGQDIHLFGFSRGAAMANELAKRLASLGMRVAFVGMFDPVYSVGRAGQNSRYVDSTYAGSYGNYVDGTISGNVDAAAVLYAINEDRSFFPATNFTALGSTKLLRLMSPGAHSDIGGHFTNNLLIQQMNLRAMIEFARGYGSVDFKFRGIEDDIGRIISSPLTKAIALMDTEDPAEASKQWNSASKFEMWLPITPNGFLSALRGIGNGDWDLDWEPGGYGVQKGWSAGVGAAIAGLFVDPSIRYMWDPPSPISSHIRRSFTWENRELWDLPLSDSNGKPLSLTVQQKTLFRMLYLRRVDSYKGGWLE